MQNFVLRNNCIYTIYLQHCVLVLFIIFIISLSTYWIESTRYVALSYCFVYTILIVTCFHIFRNRIVREIEKEDEAPIPMFKRSVLLQKENVLQQHYWRVQHVEPLFISTLWKRIRKLEHLILRYEKNHEEDLKLEIDTLTREVTEKRALQGADCVQNDKIIVIFFDRTDAILFRKAYPNVTQWMSTYEDTNWGHIYNKNYCNWILKLQSTLLDILTLILTIFWSIPIGAIGVLLDKSFTETFVPIIQHTLPFVYTPSINSIISLSIVSLFLCFVPSILYYISEKKLYMTSYSSVECETIKKYYVFCVLNVVLIFTIGSAFISTTYCLIHNSEQAPRILAMALPIRSQFCINYILWRLISNVTHLLRLPKLFRRALSTIFPCTTRNKVIAKTYIDAFPFYEIVPQEMLIFNMVTIYALISPLIRIIGFLYFFCTLIIHTYVLETSSAPKHRNTMKNRGLSIYYCSPFVGLLLFHLMSLGIELINNELTLAFLYFVIGLATCLFYLTTSRKNKDITVASSINCNDNYLHYWTNPSYKDDLIKAEIMNPLTCGCAAYSFKEYKEEEEGL